MIEDVQILVVIFSGIVLIILASALVSAAHKYIDRRNKGAIPSDAEKRINARMDELDRRLTDIQDILITIDEKFERLNNQSSVAPSPPPQTISD